MRKLFFLIILLLNLTAFAAGQTQTGSGEASEVLRLDEARFAAMIRADIAELEKILADDLVYTHSSGRVESKKEFIASLETGTLKYISIHNEEKKARVYGTTALINGRAKITISSQGQQQSFVLRYLDVYVKRNNKWQMVAWQSTRLP